MNSDLIRGNVDTIILKCLAHGEMYGVEIASFIEKASNGTYQLNRQTMYSALTRLRKKKLVSLRREDSPIGGERNYFKLTPAGLAFLADKKVDWQVSKTMIDSLVFDKVAIEINHPVTASPCHPSIKEGNLVAVTTTVKEVTPLQEYVAFTGGAYIAAPFTAPLTAQGEVNVAVAVASEKTPAARGGIAPTQLTMDSYEITTVKTGVNHTPNQAHPVKTTPSSAVFNHPVTPAACHPSIKEGNFGVKVVPASAPVASVPVDLTGVALRPFVKHAGTRKSGKFVLYNKLRLVSAALVCVALAIGMLCTTLFLKPTYTAEERSFLAIGWVVLAVYMLINIAIFSAYPRYKKVVVARTKDLMRRGAFSVCIMAAAICICLIAGLSAINAGDFLVYWVVPCVIGSLFLLEGLAIWALRKNSFFLT